MLCNGCCLSADQIYIIWSTFQHALLSGKTVTQFMLFCCSLACFTPLTSSLTDRNIVRYPELSLSINNHCVSEEVAFPELILWLHLSLYLYCTICLHPTIKIEYFQLAICSHHVMLLFFPPSKIPLWIVAQIELNLSTTSVQMLKWLYSAVGSSKETAGMAPHLILVVAMCASVSRSEMVHHDSGQLHLPAAPLQSSAKQMCNFIWECPCYFRSCLDYYSSCCTPPTRFSFYTPAL